MPPTMSPAMCEQEETMRTSLSSVSSSNDALVYCIEPMPSTVQALQHAANVTGWSKQLKVLQLAMNNQDPSTIPFPKPTPETVGQDDRRIANACVGSSDQCVPVETKRLDLMMRGEHLADRRVHALLIDMEGFDFEVLQGGSSTLRNTEYVEIEFHSVGQVSSRMGSVVRILVVQANKGNLTNLYPSLRQEATQASH